MARLMILVLIALWFFGLRAFWIVADIHDAETARQFAFLAVPPTIALLVLLTAAKRFTKK
jgi:hypothetical protein